MSPIEALVERLLGTAVGTGTNRGGGGAEVSGTAGKKGVDADERELGRMWGVRARFCAAM